jgi:hypothetical protein
VQSRRSRREGDVLPAGQHPALVDGIIGRGHPGHAVFGAIRTGQRVVIDESDLHPGRMGSLYLGREVLGGSAGRSGSRGTSSSMQASWPV